MKFIRLETYAEKWMESEPFLFCKGCGRYAGDSWRFCPWCGHKYRKETEPLILKTTDKECPTHEDKLKFIKEQLKG